MYSIKQKKLMIEKNSVPKKIILRWKPRAKWLNVIQSDCYNYCHIV